MQEFGNLRRVFDSQSYQGENSYFCGQSVLLLGVYLHIVL